MALITGGKLICGQFQPVCFSFYNLNCMPKAALTSSQIREKLIEAGVKNLKDFGYPAVDKNNILTDQIYSVFFKNMLNENYQSVPGPTGKCIDEQITKLLKEIK